MRSMNMRPGGSTVNSFWFALKIVRELVDVADGAVGAVRRDLARDGRVHARELLVLGDRRAVDVELCGTGGRGFGTRRRRAGTRRARCRA